MHGYPQWRWHLDEVFVKVNESLLSLRAVDHEGEVLQLVVTAKRDKAAAVKFLKHIMKKYGRTRKIVTDGLRAYSAAMREVGTADRQEVGRGLNNRAEDLHQPFRRRERAMQLFRSMKTLQKISSVHAQVHNHFNQERPLVTRLVYKQRRSAALAEWRARAARTRLREGMSRYAPTTNRYFDKAPPMSGLGLRNGTGLWKTFGHSLCTPSTPSAQIAVCLRATFLSTNSLAATTPSSMRSRQLHLILNRR